MVEIAITLVEHPEWARGPTRIEGNAVILDESRAERYWFYETEEVDTIAFDLAAMALHRSGRNPEQVRAFARRYGLLWHGADKLGSGDCRESLDSWWDEAQRLSSVLFISIRLGQAMREGTAAPIRKYLDSLGITFDPPTDETYLMAATTMIARLLNQGLQDSKWGMTVSKPGDMRLAHYPPNLVSAAHANLAMLTATKTEFKECPGCGRAFLPDSGKQKYHDPLCATKSRQRRWKRKKSDPV